MKKAILYIFNKWWIPIIFCVFTFVLFVTSMFAKNNVLYNISFILLGFALLLLVISSIYQSIKHEWKKAIVTFLSFCALTGIFLIYSFTALFTSPYFDGSDSWADNLTIPNNIAIENPIDLNFDYYRPDSLANRQITETEFQLYNSLQPGLYEYDLWIGKIENGTIYLKAFEITQDYALSKDKLPKSSSITIHNPTDSIKKFGTTSHFTIYEGDWGKPYAARFEIWFKPDSDGKERKLLTKNYKIEGWMR